MSEQLSVTNDEVVKILRQGYPDEFSDVEVLLDVAVNGWSYAPEYFRDKHLPDEVQAYWFPRS